MSVEDLQQSPMMNHMLEALDRGEDIGHFGRLTFVMVARATSWTTTSSSSS
jgi:hypothetical protein